MVRRFSPLLFALLAGCATDVPLMIRTPPVKPISIADVQRAPDDFIGVSVRWGGTVVAVDNRKDHTEIVVVARPLDSDGEPRASADPIGRFIAEVAGFVDPEQLPTDRRLTVAGPITSLRVQEVGEYPYRYPVVAATSRWLWSEDTAVQPVYGYPWYHPWYGWYGYGPWYGPRYRPWYW